MLYFDLSKTNSTKMTKAEKRHQDSIKTQLRHLLNAKLSNFKNDYLQSNIDFHLKRLEKGLANAKEGIYSSGWTQKQAVYHFENTLSRPTLITLKAINEANEDFENKIERVVTKIAEADFTSTLLKVETDYVRNIGKAFEFLVSSEKDGKEVHARVIWVNGVEKVSHFRFITTVRKTR